VIFSAAQEKHLKTLKKQWEAVAEFTSGDAQSLGLDIRRRPWAAMATATGPRIYPRGDQQVTLYS
jgi:hypothetical protein